LASRRAATGRPVPPRPHTPFVSFACGLDTLVTAALQRIGSERLRLRTTATAIQRRDSGFEVALESGDSIGCNAVVLATPAGPTARLLTDVAPDAAADLDAIPYVSSATVSLAYRAAALAGASGGRGFVVPRVEGLDLTAVTWSSRKFAGRAPEGHLLLRGFVGRAGNEGPAFLQDDQVVETVRRDLAKITGIRADPEFAQVFRWHNAMPQYHVGHAARVERIERAVGLGRGLTVVGAAYRGVGIPDCITYATQAARRLAAEL
jgi:oxygen-dependent protoporphyrinogen oxidase